jgi:hypothetical protein
MVGHAHGVVDVWGTTLVAAAEDMAYSPQQGTPPQGFHHPVTDGHAVIDAAAVRAAVGDSK